MQRVGLRGFVGVSGASRGSGMQRSEVVGCGPKGPKDPIIRYPVLG